MSLAAMSALLAFAQADYAAAEPKPAPKPIVLDVGEFTRVPTAAQFARAYPVRARPISGHTTIDCAVGAKGVLKDCILVEELPSGAGLGSAALKVARYFRLPEHLQSGEVITEGGRVTIPLTWIDPRH